MLYDNARFVNPCLGAHLVSKPEIRKPKTQKFAATCPDIPHFVKMLYDNAQLVNLYLDAHLVSKSEIRNPNSEMFADTARDILDYVLRDMTHPDGGFYSAEDADSEGHEGKFYCWTRAELLKLLSPEEFNVAVRYFGVTEQGNFVDHSHPQPLTNQNVLSVVEPLPGRDALDRKSV